MGFVVVQHLNPDRDSNLAEVLQHCTTMPVSQVTKPIRVQSNHIYVIPPGRRLRIEEGILQVVARQDLSPRFMPIDEFLHTLAEDRGEQAICVILSGAGTDGLLGLKSIKERGGVVMAQSPENAIHASMPLSAIESGLADVVAEPGELARRLVAVQRTAQLTRMNNGDSISRINETGINETGINEDLLLSILAEVRAQAKHDFRFYKRSTVLRRISRRMRANGLATLDAYLDYIRQQRSEIHSLFKDLLISVTNFFRDRDAFAALAEEVIPRLFAEKDSYEPVRVWVAGCAGGEEAYSLAMLLEEAAPPNTTYQIFATDLDEDALARARAGIYLDAIEADVSAERLARHFTRQENGYRVNESIRDAVLFTRHNLIADPPFSRLDLISCRNLMIYFDRTVQQRVLANFHFALNNEGILLLGNSETVNGSDRFQPLNKKERIYQRVPGPGALYPSAPPLSLDAAAALGQPTAPQHRVPISDLHRDLMLQRYAPPSLLVDSNYDVRYLFGDVGRYFHPAEGEPSHNLLQNINSALRIELRAALFRIFQKNEHVDPRRITLSLREPSPLEEIETILLRVEAVQSTTYEGPLALVIFEPAAQTVDAHAVAESVQNEKHHNSAVAQLEDELQRTRQRMQTVVEEYETATEELKASNNELRSTNEELWSTTEELETSKEELQSTNEELHSVNNELKAKIDEVIHANSDLQNLMASTHIATLFLDRTLRLQRYTPEAISIFNLIPTDVGRPFAHISHRLLYDNLVALAERVLQETSMVEEEIQSRQGNWYIVRLVPYRSLEDKIDGVVVTAVDISQLKLYQNDILVRERQQADVSELGLLALSGMELPELMAHAVTQVVGTLNVPLCKVLELVPGEQELLLKVGIGWQDGLAGTATVEVDRRSQAGYTLHNNAPVVVSDLATETRFSGPSLLTDHGVVSGISVVIQGKRQPYGVLGAHTTAHRNFTEHDANFLQSMANVLGVAIERSIAEAAVQASEDRYHDALKNSPVVFARIDTGLRYEWIFNPHPDFDSRNVIGKRDDELDTSAGSLALMQIKSEVLAGGKQQRSVIAFQRSDGLRTYDITVTPVCDESGQVIHLITTALDISERRQAQQALRASKALFEAVLKNLPTGVIIADAPTGRTILGNEQVAAIWRHPFLHADQVEGYRAYKGFHSDGTPLAPDEWPLARAIAHGEVTQDREIRFERGDGSIGTLSVSAAPVYDGEGNITAGVVVFNDISERKQVEDDLRRLTETLEERIEERTAQIRVLASQLTLAEQRERRRVSMVLHEDLQQLLFAVQFQLRVLENALEARDVPIGITVVQGIKEILERSLKVTRTLSIDLSPPVLRGEGLVEAIKWLGSQMKELHDLQISVEADTPILLTSVDMRILLFHLVRELLLNVVKHAGVDQARVYLHQQGEILTIEVEDKGSGLAPNAIEVPPPGEIGGGLFHMQERLTLFGGHLTIHSSQAIGTRAIIQVPLSDSRLTAPSEETP